MSSINADPQFDNSLPATIEYGTKAQVARDVWKRIVALTNTNTDVPETLLAEFLGALRETFAPYECVLRTRGESCSAIEAQSRAVVCFLSNITWQLVLPRGRPRPFDVIGDEISSVLQLIESEIEELVQFEHLAEEIVAFVQRGRVGQATALLKGFWFDIRAMLHSEQREEVDDRIVAPLFNDPGYFPERCESWLRNHFPWLLDERRSASLSLSREDEEVEPENLEAEPYASASEASSVDSEEALAALLQLSLGLSVSSYGDNEVGTAEPVRPFRPGPVRHEGRIYAPVYEDHSSDSDALSPEPETPPPPALAAPSTRPCIVDLVSDEPPSFSFGEIVDLTGGADDVTRDHMEKQPGDISHQTLLPVSMSEAELSSLVTEPALSSATPSVCPFPDENDRPSKRPRNRASVNPLMAIESLLIPPSSF